MNSTPRPRHLPRPSVRACAEFLGARVTGSAAASARTGAAVTGITHDAQAVQPGDLYVAWPGAARHGAEFAGEAARAGAVAVVTDAAGAAFGDGLEIPILVVPDVRAVAGRLSAHVYGDVASGLAVFGVTGTNGKTTTSYLMDGGLRRAGLKTGVVGTVQILIGDEVVPTKRTTPEAPDLQAILATATERGVDAIAMEVSSHALTYGRTAGIRFEAAAFLNLTQDHLDFHPTLEDYFEAKAKLFTPDYTRRAVVNVGDPYGRVIAGRCREQGIDLHTFSTSATVPDGDFPHPDWTVADLVLGPDGSTFTVVGPAGVRVPGLVRLPGPFNVENALAAVVLLAAAGIDPATAAAGVGDVAGVPGRMERVSVDGQEFLSVVDYAHTPDAVETALKALRPVTEGKLRIVVGCGGDRDRAKRPLMGAAAVRLADEAVFTDDNPRSENSADILAAVTAGAEAECTGTGCVGSGPGGRPEAAGAAGHTGTAGDAGHGATVEDKNAENAGSAQADSAEAGNGDNDDNGDAGRAALGAHTYRVIADRAEAIAYAVSRSGPGDVLIVAGKGHEQGQETAGVIRPFDDRVVLRAALEAARGARR